MADLHSMDSILDDIFASYMRVKSSHAGQYDRDFRNPQHLIKLAHDLDIIPPPGRTIRITGSKGKGTTSRLIATYLHETIPSAKVGLLVSPEEFTHLDRMKIDGIPIPQARFISLYNHLRPKLGSLLDALGKDGYLSPSGIFLLIALLWFREEEVDHYVLEAGRGAQFDEVGRIRSLVGVVTSLFLEHASNLGPALEDIAADKLSISLSSDMLVCPTEIKTEYTTLIHAPIADLEPQQGNQRLPFWLKQNDQIARTAAKAYLASHGFQMSIAPLEASSPSFVWASCFGTPVLIEAIISASSADAGLYAAQFAQKNVHVMLSLPDDKDRDGLIGLWKQLGLKYAEIALSGTRGYLHYTKARQSPDFLTEIAFDAPDKMRQIIKNYIDTHKPDVLYLAGTQTYIRLVKQALWQEL